MYRSVMPSTESTLFLEHMSSAHILLFLEMWFTHLVIGTRGAQVQVAMFQSFYPSSALQMDVISKMEVVFSSGDVHCYK
jgi:hypothetical protein